jgi:hypothetical protein
MNFTYTIEVMQLQKEITELVDTESNLTTVVTTHVTLKRRFYFRCKFSISNQFVAKT